MFPECWITPPVAADFARFSACNWRHLGLGNEDAHTYILIGHAVFRGSFSIRETAMSASVRAVAPARDSRVCEMRHRRRRVFIDSHRGRVSAGFTVAAEADAADVSMRLRERGWIAYRLRLEPEQHSWVATVIDWTRRAA